VTPRTSSSIVRSASLCASLLAALAGASRAEAAPRTILHNGKVFTAEPCAPWAQAIAVEGQTILAVGSDADVLAAARPDSTVIDLGGRTVIPGLNDAHVHVLDPGGALVDSPAFIPGPGPALAELLSDIAATAGATPPGTWLYALVGTAITDDPTANRFALDVVSPDHPVRVRAWSGHGTILNTMAMEMLGIPLDVPDPFGGSYERVPGTDVADGVMHEYAEYDVQRRLYGILPDAGLVGQYQAYAGAAVSVGATTLQDIPIGLRQERSAALLAAANLPIRVRSICFPLTPDEPCEELEGRSDDALVRFTGIKWITDGTPIERFAFLEEPYADRPGWYGVFNLPDPALELILRRAQEGSAHRHQIVFHSVGDAAVANVLDALDATGGGPAWHDRRPRIEHGDLITADDYPRVLEDGAVIVQNGTHLALPDIFHARLTPARYATIQPLRSLLDAGIPLALGTDAIGMFRTPWLDIMLTTIHPDQPTQAITIEEAVTAYTLGSAYAEMEEDRKGSLRPGKLADLAVLSQDVFTLQDPTLIPNTGSVLTMVGGAIVFDAGVLGQ
jgi:predicted amidohydrolase YtcJ